MPKILFLLRFRDAPWGHHHHPYHGPYHHLSSGLRNSVRFVVDMLLMLGIEAKWVECQDANSIDREVTAYRPTHVILEALWVPPAKFDALKPLHPHVSWLVRMHSETPFLAHEGIGMEWLTGYLKRGIEVTCNSQRLLTDLQGLGFAIGHPELISYTPNYYPVHHAPIHNHLKPHPHRADDTVRIGCFGAIRPLKNQLLQAIAALRYAYALGKKLEFHVNSTRIEGGANPVIKNLRGLFEATPRANLVEHGWLDHDKFLTLLHSMDMLLQVSFSETFNIVSADAVAASVPVVASEEVAWLSAYAQADPNDSTSVLNKMLMVHRQNRNDRLNWQWRDLTNFSMESRRVWWSRFGCGPHPFELAHITAAAEAKKPHKPKPDEDHHHHPHPPHPPHPYYGDV